MLYCSIESYNYRARSITQSSLVGSQPSMNPYSVAGLLGTNQVVSLADSGLDMHSCYFEDFNGNVAFSLYNAPITDPSKRKVIQYCYTPDSDTTDTKGGHGTHVAGTIGANVADSTLYTGILCLLYLLYFALDYVTFLRRII